MRILFIEDDASLREGIAFKLHREGHEVIAYATAQEGCAHLRETSALAILDIGLPDGNGLAICRELRGLQPDIHILMLTCEDTELDQVMGYEHGCDDYLTKPFSLAILMGKVAALQRRLEASPSPPEWTLDAAFHRALWRGSPVDLTRNESRLLEALLRNRGQVLTKAQLLAALWDMGGDFVDENTLAVNIRRLREKIEEDPSNPRWIQNVRGVGYRFREDRHEA